MHLSKLALFITLECAVHVYAFDAFQDQDCSNTALDHCDSDSTKRYTQPYDIAYYRCMSGFWRSHSTSNDCPHSKVGCNCYNGCVADRHDWAHDVGTYCVNACDMANKQQMQC
ncbi:hypothetical protein V8E36_006865 [Tilletia maclaganii]